MNAITEQIIENLIDLSWKPYRLMYGRFPKEYSRNSINVAVKRLEKRGIIQKGLMEDEICIRLTELGLSKRNEKNNRKILKPAIELKNQKWDKKWRVVVFDIPEENRRIRRALRDMLKILEFYPLQRSVWVSKNNYTRELRTWVKELRLSHFIKVLETNDLG